MEGACVQGISSYVPQHDRLRLWSSRWHFKFLTNTLILFLIFTLSATYPFSHQQVDDLAPMVSRSGRLMDLLQWGPISLIGHNAPSLATLMHRNICFKKTTKQSKVSPSVAAATLAQTFKVNSQFSLSHWFHSIHTLSFQGTSAAVGTSSVTPFSDQTLAKLHQFLFLCITYESLVFVTPDWCISKDQEDSNIGCRCPPAQLGCT